MAESVFKIRSKEQVWVDNYDFLLKQGYRLRKRYQSGWIGSWVLKGVSEQRLKAMGKKRYTEFEDSVVSESKVVDAVRISDDNVVALKHIIPPKGDDPLRAYKHSFQEHRIMKLLASPEIRDDPRNPCPLLLDSFPLPNPEDGIIMVMTLTRYPFIPRFHPAVEALSFVRQMLEVEAFYLPQGWYFFMSAILHIGDEPTLNYCTRERHLPPEPPHLDRIDVKHVRYYLIDYGYSLMFPGHDQRFPVLNTGAYMRLEEFYEEDKAGKSVYALHDPFKADLKQLGKLIRILFGSSLPFLKPLLSALEFQSPEERPDAAAALAMFKQLTKSLCRPTLLRHVRQGVFYQVCKDNSAFHRWWWMRQGTFGWARATAKAIVLKRGRSS
ncbi:hypothetical protein VNI00_010767 [Paramarasmius palmivorus]|uniref:Protein kinase domain-containing protein n=1 Tax=Paramarasmius palmivorus TaxID=297713 RepID=A0AAW0CHK4_9AGAR